MDEPLTCCPRRGIPWQGMASMNQTQSFHKVQQAHAIRYLPLEGLSPMIEQQCQSRQDAYNS